MHQSQRCELSRANQASQLNLFATIAIFVEVPRLRYRFFQKHHVATAARDAAYAKSDAADEKRKNFTRLLEYLLHFLAIIAWRRSKKTKLASAAQAERQKLQKL